MKKATPPKGFSEERIRAIAAHYDNQTEEEAVAEDVAAWGDSRFTFVQVPVEMVDDVRKLVARREKSQQKGGKSESSGIKEKRAPYGRSKS